MAGGAFFVDLELDRHLVAQRGLTERYGQLHLDVLTALGATRPCARAAGVAAAEHRAEDVAQPTEAADVEILESEAAGASAGGESARRARAGAGSRPPSAPEAAETPKGTELSHLIVLLATLRVAE